LKDEEMTAEVLPVGGDEKHYPIAFNALPQIDLFEENGYTKEEMKMINETKKIMSDDSLSVAATCVRLPIYTSQDRKSTRLNSSHVSISYAVFCLKKKNKIKKNELVQYAHL